MIYKDKMLFLASHISYMENSAIEKKKMSRKTKLSKPLIYKGFQHISQKNLIFFECIEKR